MIWLEPQIVSPATWYYEYPRHMLLVHRVYNGAGDYIETEQIKIPWRKIRTSLKRAYRPRKRVRRER